MIFTYTQISNYLRCTRCYRLRYLDGWQERETRAGMVFGRCFEQALGAIYFGEDAQARLFQEWSAYRDASFIYKHGDSWDRRQHQEVHLLLLLQCFAQQNRIQIRNPQKSLQAKVVRALNGGHEFVSYLDAIGSLVSTHSIIDWKTTTSRYPEAPMGLLWLDPRLISYSWVSGISEVAVVVFVRKHAPEIQYLKATISEEQRQEYGRLLEETVSRILAGRFASHSGIRYPQNGCVTCSHLGLCLNDTQLVETRLIRKAGANDFDWLYELVD